MNIRCLPRRRIKLGAPWTDNNHHPSVQDSPRRLLSQKSSPRPRIPFLAQSTADSRQMLLQRRVARVLSTENKDFVRRETWFGLKLGLFALVLANLAGIAIMSFEGEQMEKRRPSPSEWTYLTRSAWRAALEAIHAAETRGFPVDNGQVGNYWLTCLRRLEDARCDGTDLLKTNLSTESKASSTGEIELLSVDASRKSEEWRAGYVEVILELGKAAEAMRHFVFDRKSSKYFHESSVLGPSNPRPRKISDDAPPDERDCERAFPDPSIFYDRVVRGKGFSTKQRIEVMHASANWQQFIGRGAEADVQFADALDVARRFSAKFGTDASSLDTSSANTILSSMEHASHLARTGRSNHALPIYLNCLRAIRTVDAASSSPSQHPTKSSDNMRVGFWADLSKRLFREDRYPLPQTSGNESLSTASPNALKCLEGEIMMYIGEILFSSSPLRRNDGLSWTREATDLTSTALYEHNMAQRATKDLQQMVQLSGLQIQEARRCQNCLVTSVRNWNAMLAQMTAAAEQDAKQSAAIQGWRSWFANASATEKSVRDMREQSLVLEGVKTSLLSKGILTSDAFAT